MGSRYGGVVLALVVVAVVFLNSHVEAAYKGSNASRNSKRDTSSGDNGRRFSLTQPFPWLKRDPAPEAAPNSELNRGRDAVGIIFPEDGFPGRAKSALSPKKGAVRNDSRASDNSIPLSLIKEMNRASTFTDIQTRYLLPNTDSEVGHRQGVLKAGLFGRNAANGRERNIGAVSLAPRAACDPQTTVVPFEKPSDPLVILYPTCTRLQRCGGCCDHELLECAPVKTEDLDMLVKQMRYIGNSKFEMLPDNVVTVQKHLQCECQCRVKKENCTMLQRYLPNECKCECKNQDEASQCDGDNKWWNPSECRCACIENRDCSSGSQFNNETCMCEQIRVLTIGSDSRMQRAVNGTNNNPILPIRRKQYRNPRRNISRARAIGDYDTTMLEYIDTE